MKKIVISAIVCAMAALAMTPGHAAVDVTATILTPTPLAGTGDSGSLVPPAVDCRPEGFPEGSSDCEKGVLAKIPRCLYTLSDYLATGVVDNPAEGSHPTQTEDMGVNGFVIPISGETQFTLASSPADTADFDVTFYVDLPICDVNAPEYGPGVDSVHAHFGNGTESGVIPEETGYAIVTLWGSAAQSFNFTAS